MIPILYDSTEATFTSNGLGRLSDAIRCEVTEVRNGIYELELDYPVDGIHYGEITTDTWIGATHDEQGDRQPFRVYGRSATIGGVTTFYAHHISYLLGNVILKPFTATSCADALSKFETEVYTAQPFTFWTDKATGGNFTLSVPEPAKKMLGGVRGSILDVFCGGEYEFDLWTVKLYQHRGSDRGVTIRYGKNLTQLTDDADSMDVYDAVIPYWTDGEGSTVIGSKVVGHGSGARCTTLDLSQEYETAPTAAQLQSRAASFMASNAPWIPKQNIKISFAALWQTEEFKNVAPLERVRLCDTVTVIYTALGVQASAKVIKTVYNTLLDRYESIELGEAKTSFAETITASIDEIVADLPTVSMMDKAINKATQLITGGLGGYVVLKPNADGEPEEILIMDSPDIATAVNVIRMNRSGIGFSNTGYSGTYTTAWTIDGAFTADVITAGTMLFNRMKGGTLTLGGSGNGNGVLVVKDASGTTIGTFDKDGIFIENGKIKMGTAALYAFMGNVISKTVRIVDGDIQNSPVPTLCVKNASSKIFCGINVGGMVRQEVLRSNESITTDMLSSSYADGGHTEYIYNNAGTHLYLFEKAYKDGGIEMELSEMDTSGIVAPEDFTAETISNYALIMRVMVGKLGAAMARTFRSKGSVPTDEVLGNATISATGRAVMLTDGAFIAQLSTGSRMKYNASGLTVNGNTVAYQSSSSLRYKHDITANICKELDPHKLYELQMVQFVFNDDHPLQYDDMRDKVIPGFIAEDVAQIYPAATIHDAEGVVESWDERRIIPGMLKLIQEQKDQIDALTKRIEVLEELLGVTE